MTIETMNAIQRRYPDTYYIILAYFDQDWIYMFDTKSIIKILHLAIEDESTRSDLELEPGSGNFISGFSSLQHLHSELYDIVHRKTPKEQKEIFDALDPDLYLETEGAIELFFHSLLCITQNHLRSLNIPIPDNPPLHTEKDTSDE